MPTDWPASWHASVLRARTRRHERECVDVVHALVDDEHALDASGMRNVHAGERLVAADWMDHGKEHAIDSKLFTDPVHVLARACSSAAK